MIKTGHSWVHPKHFIPLSLPSQNDNRSIIGRQGIEWHLLIGATNAGHESLFLVNWLGVCPYAAATLPCPTVDAER